MTNNFDYQIEILQAAKEGKTIQVKARGSTCWKHRHDKASELFNFASYDYRVKKEPDVIYSVSYKRGSDWSIWSNHFSKKDAESVALAAQDGGYTVIIRKFVEVLEDED